LIHPRIDIDVPDSGDPFAVPVFDVWERKTLPNLQSFPMLGDAYDHVEGIGKVPQPERRSNNPGRQHCRITTKSSQYLQHAKQLITCTAATTPMTITLLYHPRNVPQRFDIYNGLPPMKSDHRLTSAGTPSFLGSFSLMHCAKRTAVCERLVSESIHVWSR